MVVALMAILLAIMLWALNVPKIVFGTALTRTDAELTAIYRAVNLYKLKHGVWPDDVDRGLPNGIEEFLGPGEWPDAPLNDVSVYDWDNFTGSDGNQVVQISVRFCPLGNSSACQFPDVDWAEDFNYHSSYYLCIEGICRAHPGKPDNHPGYCMNCPTQN